MAHEILALQIVEVLLGEPTDDSVEIAVNFVKEVGQMLEVWMYGWMDGWNVSKTMYTSIYTRLTAVHERVFILPTFHSPIHSLIHSSINSSIQQEVSPKGLRAIFERFRGILHEGMYPSIHPSIYLSIDPSMYLSFPYVCMYGSRRIATPLTSSIHQSIHRCD